MARIRSIKPDFWADGKIGKLSDGCALFFIGLWNFCDDEGKCLQDSFELSSKMPRFKSQHVSRWIQTLFECGLIRLSTDFKWLSIAHWNHQKIDRPRTPSFPISEIEWLPTPTCQSSPKPRRVLDASSTIIRRKDRIGLDGIGEDRIGKDIPTSEVHSPPPGRAKKFAPTAKAWEAYSEAYEFRYGTFPVRNTTINSQLSNFVKRIGEEESPLVAAFYLTHNDQFYVRSMHPIGLMLRDAEKLRTEYVTGKKMTTGQARQVDRKQTTYNAFAPLLAEAEAREKEREKEKHGNK